MHEFPARRILSAAPRRVAIAALLVLATLGAASGRLAAELERGREDLPFEVAAATLPSETALALISLGHREALADLMWLNALSYFAQHRGRVRDAHWLRPHLQAITHLDPRFELVYAWAATVTMYGGRIDRETVLASNEILTLGIEAFPTSWELHFMLAVNLVFELEALDADERVRNRELGARMMARASALPSAPAFIQGTAAALLRRSAGARESLATAYDALVLSNDDSIRRSAQSQATLLLPSLDRDGFLRSAEVIRASRTEPALAVAPAQLQLLLHPDLARWTVRAPDAPEESP